MKRIAAFLAAIQLALVSSPLLAQGFATLGMENNSGSYRTVTTQSWVEEWDPVQGRWVKVADDEVRVSDETLPTVVTTIVDGKKVSEIRSAARYARPAPRNRPSMARAQFGPFVVVSPSVAQMVGSTNDRSPHDFEAMLHEFPGIETLEMVEAPGTSNDIANLAVGRKIREAGISTHVPRRGSVRSGAVELFLAGESRSIEDGATFAVHSWLDNHGREADDFAANHPAHRLYLDYYVEMGMSENQAHAFYAMTNSVPHASARWLDAVEMRGWIAPQTVAPNRYAVRKMPRICAFCENVSASLAETNANIAEMNWEPISVETTNPVINYGDLTKVRLSWSGMSLLDS
ncbi:alpha/beta hydrolase [uncultured Erythrobacter sp.]|uniref:alpha/beta hydrolase n=1 Tax=uncultured Erythrobacter sp. TaxID=263913 RepID=UPI002628058A|nr:alpha/beta hydrolase [uncultured Erythrobacter sp.]